MSAPNLTQEVIEPQPASTAPRDVYAFQVARALQPDSTIRDIMFTYNKSLAPFVTQLNILPDFDQQ